VKSWVFILLAVLLAIGFVIGIDVLHLIVLIVLVVGLAVAWETANRPPGIQDRPFPLPNLFRTGVTQRFTFLTPNSTEPIGSYAGVMAERVLREASAEFPDDPLLTDVLAAHGNAFRYLPQRKLTEALDHIDELFSQGER